MPRKPIFSLALAAVLLLAVLACQAGSTARDWAKITTPAKGEAQSIGKYTSGCLRGAAALPIQGQGYQVMRLSRQRYYGHPQLVRFIGNLGAAVSNEHLGSLLIGDLGQPRGGPTLSGHRSHQTGLDVDIWFMQSEQADKRLLSEEERETWSAAAMVDLNTDAIIDRNWTDAHPRILQIAAQQPEVERIFVNASIKRELCRYKTPTDTQWLRKIRPWWKHEDHFHVRLKCPANSPLCEGQDSIPAGDGCDASLAWWFSEEAKHPATTPSQTPAPPAPLLPEQCERLLRE